MSNTTPTIPVWDYSDITGPSKWATLCSEFAAAACYQYQSPIAISTNQSSINPELTDLEFSYHQQTFTTKFYTQSLHLVPNEFENELFFNNEIYTLQDIHIHIPNEHIIDDKIRPLEIHYVHRTKQEAVLVLAIFVEINEHAPQLPIIDWTIDATVHLNPSSLLPSTQHFYTYTGSLTTPPTTGPVTWVLLKETQSAQPGWFTKLRNALPHDNARPTQPLNDRTIHFH